MKIELFITLLVLLASTNVFGQRTKPGGTVPTDNDNDMGEPDNTNRPGDKDPVNVKEPNANRPQTNEGKETPTLKGDENKPLKPVINPTNVEDSTKNQGILIDGKKDKENLTLTVPPAPTITVLRPRPSQKVHVSGKIYLHKYETSAIGSVQYDLNGALLTNGLPAVVESRSPWSQEFIARGSRVTLYVSLTKTNDRKLAFTEFEIKYIEDHFPLAFNVDIDLPSQQRGLLERADITLYFFAYINNPESRIDTFIPSGVSQILLQGTSELAQKLIVNVRASGLEIAGLFRGRFGSLFIQSGTSFQIYIVSEQSLPLIHTDKFESIAQLTVTNVPAMFPVPFSLLVQYQAIKMNINYYAIAFVNERGNRYLLTQRPILVINEQKLLVAPQLNFHVVPFPFILKGIVLRPMPGFFTLQPNSALIIRLHEIGSDSRDIIYKLPKLTVLPNYFQLNISEATRFDSSKNYDIRALVVDEKNVVYMGTLQPIPLLDEFTKLTIPVDDLLYYVRARLQSVSGVELRYVPGSICRAVVSDTPESPTEPIASFRFENIREDFREFSIQIPATAIQQNRNYYLIMMIEVAGVITHVSKTLLISNKQPPPLVIQLPVLSLNTISGFILDTENRPAQWTSSSSATLYLVTGDKDVVQSWKIHLENDFPIRFEVQVDFSRLRSTQIYRLQSSIETSRHELEYKPAGSVLVGKPGSGFFTDLRVPVRNVKTFQLVHGLIYMNDVQGPLPDKSVIIVQLSSSPSLTNPSVIEEIRIKVDGRNLPIDFTMNIPLSKINVNSVYYFIIRYTVRDVVVIPAIQAFVYSPRNQATVVLTISKSRQVLITGQVTATGNPLELPKGASIYLYITDNIVNSKPLIYSETTMPATMNSIYQYNMYIDSVTLEKRLPLFLVAEIHYGGKVILRMPRPASLQLTPGGEWNINLVVDLPTLLVGRILSMGSKEEIKGQFDVYIEIVKAGTSIVVHTIQLRLDASLPQDFRVQVSNALFIQYQRLEARALIKNCREQIIFKSGDAVLIRPGINVKIDLTVVLSDRAKLGELTVIVDESAPTNLGNWITSITGVDVNTIFGLVTVPDEKPFPGGKPFPEEKPFPGGKPVPEEKPKRPV